MDIAKYDAIADSLLNIGQALNADLFTILYGSLVAELVAQYENTEIVNEHLNNIGENLGYKLIEDFSAKLNINGFSSFNDMCGYICYVFLKVYFGITAKLEVIDDKNVHIILDNIPFNKYVILPDYLSDLCYTNIINGVLNVVYKAMKVEAFIQFDQKNLFDITYLDSTKDKYIDLSID